MNKIFLVIVVAVVLVFGTALLISGCANSKPAAKAETSGAPAAAVQGVQYTCPMHPQVISDKPGKCPICGMNLVVKK